MTNIPSLPHEREFTGILDMAMKAYEDPEYLGVIITDTIAQADSLLTTLRRSTKWDKPHTKIFREGIEVKGGGKIVIASLNSPDRLRGMRPTEIVLFGRIGELWWNMSATGCLIRAIA